ncbi:MAG TPA: cell division protein CrgA [Solirubrobacteraceae bacterium]|nr:cell division protein CrgA [Solirubrobacteraceae bacterium]
MANTRRGPASPTKAGRSAGRTSAPAPTRRTGATGRYTPPIPRSKKVSPKWMGPLILVLLIGGALMIVLNYFNVLPSGPSDWYLLGGIVLIAAGFVTATRYR